MCWTRSYASPSAGGHTTELGPKVQIYTEEGSLVKTFNQFIDARRELGGKTHQNGIIDACEKRVMYLGFPRDRVHFRCLIHSGNFEG